MAVQTSRYVLHLHRCKSHPLTPSLLWQWIFEDAGNGLYYIKSGKGVYLSWTGTPQSLTPLLGTSSKQAWKVIADTVDSSCIK